MAVSKKITKKVIATPSGGKKAEQVEVSSDVSADSDKTDRKRVCYFCQNKLHPTYTDLVTLKKYVNERGKIMPRLKTGICSKHQRAVTRSIKYARHLSLLPFTPKV